MISKNAMLSLSIAGLVFVLTMARAEAGPPAECISSQSAAAYERNFKLSKQMVEKYFHELGLADEERCRKFEEFAQNVRRVQENLRVPEGATNFTLCRHKGRRDGILRSLEAIAVLCKKTPSS